MSKSDSDLLYGVIFERALRYALRHLDADRSKDLAHDVSLSFVRRREEGGEIPEVDRELNAVIYRAVINRLIDLQRAVQRRATAEGVHARALEEQANELNNPGAILEANELAEIMRGTIAAMPPRMQRIFLLVRDHDQSYQEVAIALGVGVGTVHTQISRAYALLRDAINRYRSAGEEGPSASPHPPRFDATPSAPPHPPRLDVNRRAVP